MQVAIIGTRGYPYVYSGYETLVKELGERMAARGINVTVYCHRGLFRSRPSRVNGINLVYLPTVEKKVMSQFLHSFQAMIHAVLSGKDVILVVNPANGPFGVIARMFSCKTALNTDGLEWLRPKWRGFGAKYFRWASRVGADFFDVLISDSAEMQKVYKSQFKADSQIIAYGANIRYSAKPDLISEWGLTPGGYYLVVGRLIPDNNSETIVREFVSSASRKKLVIVGDVPYKDQYATRIKNTCDPRVLFTGYVTDQLVLDELYLNSFAYIHGHEFGGTNPTMLTAMACGCAVIALDTPFTKEMCDGDSHAIYFTKQPGHLRKLFDTLEENHGILDRLRQTARNRIEEHYTWEKITGQYVELFQSMLAKRLQTSPHEIIRSGSLHASSH